MTIFYGTQCTNAFLVKTICAWWIWLDEIVALPAWWQPGVSFLEDKVITQWSQIYAPKTCCPNLICCAYTRNQQGTMFPCSEKSEVMGIQGPMPHKYPTGPPRPKWSKKSVTKNVSLPEIFATIKDLEGCGGVCFTTTINDLNPNSGFSSKRIGSTLALVSGACGSNENPGPKRIRHTLVAASRANAPPKLCPVKIKSQSLGTALKRPRSAAEGRVSDPTEVTRATLCLKRKGIHGCNLKPFTEFFFARAKINLENQHGTENHRIGRENPSEPNL